MAILCGGYCQHVARRAALEGQEVSVVWAVYWFATPHGRRAGRRTPLCAVCMAAVMAWAITHPQFEMRVEMMNLVR